MNIAHKIKSLDGSRGEAILFRMEPPLDGHEYVVVTDMFIPETYIFGADPDGTVLDWCELPGSFQGAMDIPRALAQAGYEIKEQA
jgi:hypothetical protein